MNVSHARRNDASDQAKPACKHCWPSRPEVQQETTHTASGNGARDGDFALTPSHNANVSHKETGRKPGTSGVRYVRKDRPVECSNQIQNINPESPSDLDRVDSPTTSCTSSESKNVGGLSVAMSELQDVVSGKPTYFNPIIHPERLCDSHLIPVPTFVNTAN